MANYPGAGATDYSLVDYTYQGVVQIPQFVERYFDHDESDRGQALVSSFLSGPQSRVPISVGSADYSGSVAPSFVGDFYNRVHILPNPVEFGSVLQETTQQVEMWNAFFSPTILVDLVLLDFTGLEVDSADTPPPDIHIPALGNHLFSITATLDGPGAISGQLQFLAQDDVPVPLVGVLGKRAKLFPFVTSWEEDPRETLEWKTDIVQTEKWEEHRYRLRQYPRRTFQFGVGAVGPGSASMRSNLLSSQGAEYALPIWFYETELAQPAQKDDNVIYVPTADNDFRAGGDAFLMGAVDNFQTVGIIQVDENSLTLDPTKNINRDWPAGTTVYPIRKTRFQDQISLSSRSGIEAVATVILESVEKEDAFSSHGLGSYAGFPVLSWTPNWRNKRRFSFLRSLSQTDGGIYPKAYHLLSDRFGERQEFDWFLNGRTSVTEFRAILAYLAGRHKALWLPSHHEDTKLSEDYVYGTNSFQVENNYFSTLMAGVISKPVHMCLRTITGDEYYDEVISAVVSGANPNKDTITLRNGFFADVPKIMVEVLCRISLVRLDSDKVDIRWHTPQMATAKTSFIYVPEQPVGV